MVFDIAKGYYLYAEKVALSSKSPAVLGAVKLPKGEMHFDTTFNKTLETFRNQLVFSAPLKGVTAGQTVQITVKSQGCADIGICYPPQVQVLDLVVAASGQTAKVTAIPAAISSAAPAQAASATSQPSSPVMAEGSVATPTSAPVQAPTQTQSAAFSPVAALEQQGALAYFKIIAIFITLGVLLAFTPCVLPMLPIVSAIVMGNIHNKGVPSSRGRGLALSAAYVLGMAVVYTALGVAAGLAGQGLAAALQNAWVIGAFTLLMVALAGAQFGWYELQLPQAWTDRINQTGGESSQRSAFTGAVALGAVSALMVGPCLTAPLAAALAFIAQTGQAVKGGVALFSLALGMGLPLLLLGAGGGALLPKAGAWMERVKHVFGWGLLAVALWMGQPFLMPAVAALGWAALLLGAGVAMGAMEAATYGWARVAKALGLGLALWGAAVLWGAAGGRFDALQPLTFSPTATANVNKLSFEPITSPQTLAARLAQAKAAGQPVLLDFYADWCVSCVEMERFTFSDPAMQQALRGFVLLKADVTQNTAHDAALMKQFGLFGPPSTIFFTPQGQELTASRLTGYVAAQPFLALLARVKAQNSAN